MVKGSRLSCRAEEPQPDPLAVDGSHRSYVGRAAGWDYYEVRSHLNQRAYRYRGDTTCGGMGSDIRSGMNPNGSTNFNGDWYWVDHNAFAQQTAGCI